MSPQVTQGAHELLNVAEVSVSPRPSSTRENGGLGTIQQDIRKQGDVARKACPNQKEKRES
jgi:hypothetical protein